MTGRPYMDHTIPTEPRSPVSYWHERRNRDLNYVEPSPATARRNTLLSMCCFPPLWPPVAMIIVGDFLKGRGDD